MAVPGQRQAGIVAELARHIDDAPTLVEEQRRKAMAQVVRASAYEAGGLDGTTERSATP